MPWRKQAVPRIARDAVAIVLAVIASAGNLLAFEAGKRFRAQRAVGRAGGQFCDECLNQHWFINLAQARRIIGAWRVEYNTEGPDRSLPNRTPHEFAEYGIKQDEDDVFSTADSNSIPG